MLLTLLLCCMRAPMLLADQTRPIPVDARVASTPTTVERCTPYLFMFLPLGPAYGFPELVDEAQGDADALVDISTDARVVWWILGTTQCHILRARRVAFAAAPIPAVDGGSAPVATGGGASALSDAARSARAVVTLLYQDAGWDEQRMAAQVERDVAAVATYLMAGHTQAQTLIALRKVREAEPDLVLELAVARLPQ